MADHFPRRGNYLGRGGDHRGVHGASRSGLPCGLASLQVLLPWGLALLVVAVVPLLWLSAFPIPVAVVTVLATTAYYPLGYPDNFVILAGAVALFTLVAAGSG